MVRPLGKGGRVVLIASEVTIALLRRKLDARLMKRGNRCYMITFVLDHGHIGIYERK